MYNKKNDDKVNGQPVLQVPNVTSLYVVTTTLESEVKLKMDTWTD